MNTITSPYWDNGTILLYVALAILGAFCIKKGNDSPCYIRVGSLAKIEVHYLIWWFAWTFVASFRVINQYQIGGTDAWSYINFFQDAFNWHGKLATYEHYEIGWKLLTQLVRCFTSNFRIFLIVYHGFVVWTYIFFVKNIKIDKWFQGPFILLFFIYLRGFTSFRTNVSVGFVLIMIVFLHRNKFWPALVAGIVSVFVQLSSFLYLLIIPFWILYKRNKLKPRLVIVLVAVSYFGAVLVRRILQGPLGQLLGHSYASYASHNEGTSFFDNYWKIAIGQLFVAALLLLFNRKYNDRMSEPDELSSSIKTLRLICIFDIITIPITFIIDIWRGYEYLYLIRLMIYSETMFMFLKNKSESFKYAFKALSYVAFIGWLVFRVLNTYESSGYMPYIPCFTFFDL